MQKSNVQLRVGVIGCGHWGPNHIRVFGELERSQALMFADTSAARREQVGRRFPSARGVADYQEILDDADVNAVVIATPTKTHFKIASDALAAGKHVLVEKPVCASVAEARDLAAMAKRADRVLMVGHVFVFNSGINKLKELIDGGQLGRIQYLDAVRTNLGPVRGDVNALYDLGTHDISICNHLLGSTPTAVSAQGSCITQREVEDVCFATLHYPCGALAHLHVSWLNPRKVRTITAVGSGKMAHWDDISPEETLRLYDKGVSEPPYYNSFGEFQYALRSADVHLPAIRRSEPLLDQARAFAAWVLDGRPNEAGPEAGLAVVRVLEAASSSMRSGGALCPTSDAVGTPKTLPLSEIALPGPAAMTPAGLEPALTHHEGSLVR